MEKISWLDKVTNQDVLYSRRLLMMNRWATAQVLVLRSVMRTCMCVTYLKNYELILLLFCVWFSSSSQDRRSSSVCVFMFSVCI